MNVYEMEMKYVCEMEMKNEKHWKHWKHWKNWNVMVMKENKEMPIFVVM